nr:hypothetical protein [Paraburkholderia sp. BCC1885]
MSFIYSRALVEAFLPASFEETDVSAPSSVSHTLKPCLWHDKTTGRFPLSRFGMTCAPLTDDRGAALLTSLLADFRVKTSALQELATASTASEAGYGLKWRGSFAKYDPSESKWKTAQCSLLGDSDEFLETWPRWGSMLNGECYLRPIVAPTISASASGFWPTPTASLADKGGRVTPMKGREGGTLIEALSARMFPTPCAIDSGGGRMNKSASSGAKERPTLGLMARKGLWPTPCASASKGSSPAALTRKDGKDRSNDRIDHAVMALDGGQLNPEWVEWLMGWPIGHTALEPLATARYREWLVQHSPFSQASEEAA